MTPGATTAFKGTHAHTLAAPGTKVPGPKLQRKVAGVLPAMPIQSGLLGALLGVILGRATSAIPQLQNPTLRDAALGAAIAATIPALTAHAEESDKPDVFTPRAAQAPNGWVLQ
jgi:hypothetical protein